MHKFLSQTLLFVLLCLSNQAFGQSDYVINENFSSGVPSGWTLSSASLTSYSDIPCVGLSSGGTLITSSLQKCGTLTFSHRASGNGKTLTVEKSTDGVTWTEIGNCSPSSASSFGSSSFSINEASGTKIRFKASSGTIYITNIVITQIPNASLTISTDSLNFGDVFLNDSLQTKSFTLTGKYLTDNIVLNTCQ